jgi:hypothetical protein
MPDDPVRRLCIRSRAHRFGSLLSLGKMAWGSCYFPYLVQDFCSGCFIGIVLLFCNESCLTFTMRDCILADQPNSCNLTPLAIKSEEA